MALTAPMLLSLIEAMIEPPQVELLRAEPGLAWFEPRLAAAAQGLRTHLGGAPADDALAKAKAENGRLNQIHDAWHRYAWRLLGAFASHPDAAIAEPVGVAQNVLFPQGLAGNRVSYREEAAAVEVLAGRMARPEVATGLAKVRALGVDLEAVLNACVASGRALGAGVKAQVAIEAEASARQRSGGLFEARVEASSTFGLLFRTISLVLAGDDPAVVARRMRLLLPAQKARAALRTGGRGSEAGEMDALLTDAGLAADPPDEG